MNRKKRSIKVGRGNYDQIIQMPKSIQKSISNLLADVQNKPDEHGGWSDGISGDRKRYSAINTDVYAVARDFHSGTLLAIVQVRQTQQEKRNYWKKIRKNYFLVGRNEDGRAFAHAIPSRVIRHAISIGKDAVYAAQSWMFGGDYAMILRQGDIGLAQIKFRNFNGPEVLSELVIADSHLINADAIYQGKDLIVVNPHIVHMKGVHPDLRATGAYRLVVARRVAVWNFAIDTLD